MSAESMQSFHARAGVISKRRGPALLGTAVLVLLAAHAQADGQADTRPDSAADTVTIAQRAVPYSDLDLSQTAGAQELYSRLQLAARNVCGSHDQRQLRGRMIYERCYEKSLADAVTQVDHVALTALHEDQRLRLAGRRAAVAAGT